MDPGILPMILIIKDQWEIIGEKTRAYFRGIDESIAPPGALQEYLDCFCRRYLPHSEVEDDVKAGYYPTGLIIEFPDGMKKVIGKELIPCQ